MSLLDEEDAQPTLQVSPGALLSEEETWGKEIKKEKRKVGGLSLGRTKPRDQTSEKTSKKGKHARNRSGSRTPPDSPRADRITRNTGSKGLPSPNVKGHRKRYSQLGLDLSAEESEGDDDDDQTYFTNQAVATETSLNISNQEAEREGIMSTQPTSPVQFPVQFEESVLKPATFELPKDSSSVVDLGGPWSVPLTDTPLSSIIDQLHDDIPDSEWRISNELLIKCQKQFKDLQPTHGRLQGDQARSFFIQSHLPNTDLSAIWRLADIDCDNALSEKEFCIAMKLVLLRRKGYALPSSVPLTLKESITHANVGRTIPPQLQASHTVAEIPVISPHPTLANISQKSEPSLLVDLNDVSTTSSTIVDRDEPAVATIISIEEENDNKPTSQSFTESKNKSVHSLKEFTPPAHDSPPSSPFSPTPNTSINTDDTAPIISLVKPSPKTSSKQSKDKSGYHTLSPSDDIESEEEVATDQISIGKDKGHGRSTSLDLNKMIATSNVLSDMPAAEPPRPPPKPVLEDNDISPQVRARSASTGSISSTGPTQPVAMDTATNALLLSGSTRPIPARKAPLLPPVPKPRRPPPPRKDESSLLRNKSELQTTIRSLKDTNATLQALNRELEGKLFALMEDRVQLAREVELARQMQTT